MSHLFIAQTKSFPKLSQRRRFHNFHSPTWAAAASKSDAIPPSTTVQAPIPMTAARDEESQWKPMIAIVVATIIDALGAASRTQLSARLFFVLMFAVLLPATAFCFTVPRDICLISLHHS